MESNELGCESWFYLNFTCTWVSNFQFLCFWGRDSSTWRFFFYFYFPIIVGLHCSVSFLLYSKDTQSHIHKYIPFLALSSILLHHKWLDIFPVLYSRIPLLSYSKCNSLHLLTPNSQSIPLPPCPLPPAPPHGLFSKSMTFFSVQRFICVIR